jgi:hypothetical protein
VYQENSQQSISASRLDRSKLNDVARIEGVKDVGPIGTSSATIVFADGIAVAKPIDVSLLGIEPGKPGDVPIREGQTFSSRRANEVVVDRNTAFRAKLKPGDASR